MPVHGGTILEVAYFSFCFVKMVGFCLSIIIVLLYCQILMTVLISRARMEELALTLQIIILATVLLVILEGIVASVSINFIS